MSAKTSIKDGQVFHRTSCMTPARAEAFRKMLAANAQYEQVAVQREQAANGERTHYVTYAPSDDRRKSKLHGSQQTSRQRRAESGRFEVKSDSDNLDLFWVHNLDNGNTYAVTLFDCECYDFVTKCRKAGLLCKHMRAVLANTEQTRQNPVPRSTEAYRETEDTFQWEGLV